MRLWHLCRPSAPASRSRSCRATRPEPKQAAASEPHSCSPATRRYAEIARDAGLDYGHLTGVIKGAEPLTPSDAVDLARVLGVPTDWLAPGWDDQTV